MSEPLKSEIPFDWPYKEGAIQAKIYRYVRNVYLDSKIITRVPL